MRKLAEISIITLFSISAAFADTTDISIFKNKYGNKDLSISKIKEIVNNHFNVKNYKKIKVQMIYNNKLKPDHLLIYQFEINTHHINVVRINIDAKYNVLSIQNNYKLQTDDLGQQPSAASKDLTCPDQDIEMISFSTCDYPEFEKAAENVASIATAHNLKTIKLLKEDATKENYLNYMSCPKLKGNFFDGMSTNSMIATNDGIITTDDLENYFKFHNKVTNIWVAPYGFLEPLHTVMVNTVQSQKYAAGITALYVGTADNVGECAMTAAINGKPMESSFNDCVQQYSHPADSRGFEGFGSDYFGQ